ncbi:MAG: hypothetical protein J6112_03415 [Clostridia bacterium]|nr:hypothetical protein [Clostridia bacterium]
MKREEIYDALANIDEKYTEEAETFLSAERKDEKNSRRPAGRAVAVAAAVLAAVVVAGGAAILIATNAGRGNDAPTAAPDEGKIEATPDNGTKTVRRLDAADTAELKYYGAAMTESEQGSKPMADNTGIYYELTYPSQIKNGGQFEFMLAVGLDADYTESSETAYGEIREYRSPEVGVLMEYAFGNFREFDDKNHFVSLIVTSDHTYNGFIFFDLGYYQKYGANCQNEDFIFDGAKGMLVEEIQKKDVKDLFLYKFGQDFTLNGPLPYQRTVAAEAIQLEKGASGRISAAVHFTMGEDGLMQSRGNYVGAGFYYFCSGELIGFGETLEEAQANAAVAGENRNIVHVFDGAAYTQSEIERYRAIEEEYKKRGITIIW